VTLAFAWTMAIIFPEAKNTPAGQPGFVHVVKCTAQLIVGWRALASKVIYVS
jgi:hypothetical protein